MSQAQANTQIAILGAGSWGSALAILLAKNGLTVRLWSPFEAEISQILADGSNQRFLPGIQFPKNIVPSADLAQVVSGVDTLLIAVPSHAFRSVLHRLKPMITEETKIAWATKGLELGSGKLLHQNAIEVLGEKHAYAVLSGPTFATEVARGLPTAITVASENIEFATSLAEYLHNESFRAYTSTDLIGVQLGGALKNVLAIAAGISDGLGFGANARAALITRGLAEIRRLGIAVGGQPETFMGLAGLGDLILTCTDNQSRNRRFGLALAKGYSQQEALEEIGQVVEGVQTAKEVMGLAQHYQIEMPITQQIHAVLYQQTIPMDAVHELFRRELKAEFS